MLKSGLQLLLIGIIAPVLTSSEGNFSHLLIRYFMSSIDQLINFALLRCVEHLIIGFSMNNLCFILLPNFEMNTYPANIFYQ